MAPAARTPRGTRRTENYEAIGQKGRRTGATLKDTGIRDEHGLEPVPTFSSPEKSAPNINGLNGAFSSYTEDVTMDVGDSTAPELTEMLRTRTSNIKFPLPHARSPMKTHTGSSPRRSAGPMSPSKIPEVETPSRALLHPAPSSLAKRKFDASINEQTPPTTRISTIKRPKQTPPSARTTRGSFNVEDQSEPDETISLTNGDITTNDYIDEETPIPVIEDESLQAIQNDEDDQIEEDLTAEAGALEEPSIIPDTQVQANVPKKRGRRSLNKTTEDSQISLPSPGRRRGRPPTIHRDAPSDKLTKTAKTKDQTKKSKQALRDASSSRGPNAQIATRRQSFSKPQSRAGSVGARSHSNVERHETPIEATDALVTRSGRHSIKPLASWRGEKAVLEHPDFGAIGIIPGGIKEIIRTDEIVQRRPKKYPYRKARAKSSKLEDVEEEDEEMEEWERETGVVNASVMAWDAVEGHFIEDQLDEQEIAYAASAIEMRDISGAEFRFAKTLTLPFFGSGIVDLPPGGAKRSKNSRKMQMVFFVFYGRVTVEVGTPLTRFGIGKGGQWQVPRGNFYSITNHSTKPARIFFAQGCEVGMDGAVSA